MKICPKCNSLCEDSASFCQECGAPLPAPNDNAHTQENQKQQESQFQQVIKENRNTMPPLVACGSPAS